ncbi:MAG: tRNA pseudouridine(55) synthase TruB [Saprospiraceae bacterium]|nr:tRNA pseudouridine(55) synthase TruB [Saprospiraceae bacterium]
MPISTDQIITKNSNPNLVDFLTGTVLLIDKPLHWTSFDVVNKLRFKIKHALKVKNIKVGHAGTLDPLATGLLIICTGKLTKEIDAIQAIAKVYSGSITLGGTTATYDSEVEPDHLFPVEHITSDLIYATGKRFIGDIEQIPPIYSAIKINGQKAYDLARRGSDVSMKARAVNISVFEISEINMPVFQFLVGCSKGTYIRSLAHDFGKALHSGAYLSSLRRESIGDFKVSDAFTIEEASRFIDRVFENKDGMVISD